MTPAERQALGQWYTPPDVADLALALALPPDTGSARVLDPTCGDGAFLARARSAGVAPENLCGVELDPDTARAARNLVPGAVIHSCDLFDAELDQLGGLFDAVVGNPPYVRQERLETGQKSRIRARLARDWPAIAARDIDRLASRGDLAVACILRAMRLARPGARVALVVSSALLDAAYASALWRAVAVAGRVVALVDAPRERWFADAAINAMILVIERTGTIEPGEPVEPDLASEPTAASEPVRTVQIARLRLATADAALELSRELQSRQRSDPIPALDRVADVRRAPLSRPGRWAVHLRAPDVWFEFERTAGDFLVPLGQLAEVRRGVTSGANEVFYLERSRARTLNLEPEVLVPLLRSPRDAGEIHLDPERLAHVALLCPAESEKLACYPNASRYLESHSECADRPSLRARNPWWSLYARPARLFLTKAYGERFVQRLASAPVIADQRVYAIYPEPGIDVRWLAAILNSTYTALALESLGRSSMGEGALEWTVADAHTLPILDPRQIAPAAREAACQALAALGQRAIGSISSEHDRDDRRSLDRALAHGHDDLLALLDRIWPALIESVHDRNTRRQRFLAR